MLHLGNSERKNYQDSQKERDRLSSRPPRGRCQCTGTYAEHRVHTSPDHTTVLGTSISSSQTHGTMLTTTGCLPASLHTMAPDPRGLKSEQGPFSPGNGGEPLELPSAVFDRISERPTQVSAPPREKCGTPNSSDTWKPVDMDHTSNSMTPGQASLFDALLSLGYPHDECHDLLIPRPEKIVQAQTRRQVLGLGVEDVNSNIPEYPGASEGANNYTTRSLSLDRKVESNTLPFILNAYALWALQMMFDPLRIIQVGRTYVLWQYAASESARWKLNMVSDFAWIAGRSTAYELDDLPSFMIFQTRMCQQFLAATSTEESRKNLDQTTASDIFTFAHEVGLLLTVTHEY
ncbi:unnamed protein product [Rhizoctonia solani]|uniref:Uncharacterized protein n=1 Tax=Rhizoctonia solani TaxID=456999 RepID=A0A8H3C8X1_9AGAM|nr:unnamed protein product [Rhizoctonia solani]